MMQVSKTIEVNKEYFFIREKGVSSKLLINDIFVYPGPWGIMLPFTPLREIILFIIHLVQLKKNCQLQNSFVYTVSYVAALDKNRYHRGREQHISTSLLIPVGDAHRAELLKRINLL